MSGVVLRCPNCGTVKPAGGECDACHEASVRYFCTNHSPGVWIEGAACPHCGERFGDPVPVRKSALPPPAQPRPRDFAEPVRDAMEIERPASRSAPVPVPKRKSELRTIDPSRILLDMLEAAAARRRPPTASYDDIVHERRRGSGCVGILFKFAVFVFALLVMAAIMLGALLGLW